MDLYGLIHEPKTQASQSELEKLVEAGDPWEGHKHRNKH